MITVKLGNTGIVANKNGFGALPIQRIDLDSAVRLIHMALRGGVNFFDTARAYSDSEQKLGTALRNVDRHTYYIATKTAAQTGEKVLEDLETSLNLLQTDYIDIYQLHCAPKCFRPGDEDGVYDAVVKAKKWFPFDIDRIISESWYHMYMEMKHCLSGGLSIVLQYIDSVTMICFF